MPLTLTFLIFRIWISLLFSRGDIVFSVPLKFSDTGILKTVTRPCCPLYMWVVTPLNPEKANILFETTILSVTLMRSGRSSC